MIKYAAMTEKGVCKTNDDRIMVNGVVRTDGVVEGVVPEPLIAAVCDGVGGHAYGDEAAEIAAGVFARLESSIVDAARLEAAIQEANTRVLSAQRQDAKHQDMATTIAGLQLTDTGCIVFNVGDSRVYRNRNTFLMQISLDHTYAKEATDLGLIENKMDLRVKDRHMITRYIGSKDRCVPHVVVWENRVLKGDIFLICSDGLNDTVDDQTIERILTQQAELGSKAKTLVESALKNGSADNVSVVLLEVI